MSVAQQQQHAAGHDEDEDAEEWQSVNVLSEKGVSATDIKKLKESGVHTTKDIMFTTTRKLLQIKGLSEAKVNKIKEAAKAMESADFLTGTELREKRAEIMKITTGSRDLDALLGGGIETSCITEVFGEFRTGKSQLSHTLAVATQLPPEDGGANGKCMVIDTEGAFRPERLQPIAERFGLDADAVLENVTIARAFTSEHQAELLDQAAAMISEDQYRALIIDSATALFRVDYQGRGELSTRQQALNQFLSRLTQLATVYNLAVFITNQARPRIPPPAKQPLRKTPPRAKTPKLQSRARGQVTADPGAAAMFGDTKKPIGGHVLAHASTVRISLKKGRGEQRIAK